MQFLTGRHHRDAGGWIIEKKMPQNLIPLYLFYNNKSELYFELFLFSFFKISEIQAKQKIPDYLVR